MAARRLTYVGVTLLAWLSPSATALKIVVTAATGKVGQHVVHHSSRGSDGSTSIQTVVALVRSKEKLLEQQQQQQQHDNSSPNSSPTIVEVADYSDAAAVEAAFASAVDSPFCLFLACGNGPKQQDAELSILKAAVGTNSCEYIVKLSTETSVLEMKSGGPYEAHLAIEAAVKECGVPYTILRPNMFMEMTFTPLVGLGGSGAGGGGGGAPDVLSKETTTVAHPYADKPIAMVAAEDVARVAATLLRTKGEGECGKTLELSGPEAVSYGDLAEVITRLREEEGGVAADGDGSTSTKATPLTCEPISYLEHAPAEHLSGLRSFLEVLGGASTVTGEVERLTGRASGVTLAEFVAAHRSAFALLR